MGYKVYIGEIVSKWSASGETQITDPLTGTTEGNYFSWKNEYLIYSGTNEWILDPVLTCENRQISSFEFTVPHKLLSPISDETLNPIYDRINSHSTKVRIEEDGEVLWLGTVTEIALQFDLSKKVVCSDALHCTTHISMYMDRTEKRTISEMIESFLCFHIEGDYPGVMFPIRKGLVNFPTSIKIDFSKYGSSIQTMWATVQEMVFENYPGYLRLRYLKNSTYTDRWVIAVDYLMDIDEKTSQSIEFGKNLIDLEVTEEDSDDLVNHVTAIGQKTVKSGWWIWEKTTTEAISATAEDPDSEDAYGLCMKTVLSDTDTTEAALATLAQNTLKSYKQKPSKTLKVTAFDSRDAGVNTDHIGFLKKSDIISPPHDLNEPMVCTKATIYLAALDRKKFVYGTPPDALTKLQNQSMNHGNRSQTTLRGLVSKAQG